MGFGPRHHVRDEKRRMLVTYRTGCRSVWFTLQTTVVASITGTVAGVVVLLAKIVHFNRSEYGLKQTVQDWSVCSWHGCGWQDRTDYGRSCRWHRDCRLRRDMQRLPCRVSDEVFPTKNLGELTWLLFSHLFFATYLDRGYETGSNSSGVEQHCKKNIYQNNAC